MQLEDGLGRGPGRDGRVGARAIEALFDALGIGELVVLNLLDLFDLFLILVGRVLVLDDFLVLEGFFLVVPLDRFGDRGTQARLGGRFLFFFFEVLVLDFLRRRLRGSPGKEANGATHDREDQRSGEAGSRKQ